MAAINDKANIEESRRSADSPEVSEKTSVNQIEHVNTRADRDDVEALHDDENKVEWSWRQIVVTTSLAIVYVGSQVPLYFVGGSLQFMAKDYGGSTRLPWLPVANTLALAAVAPFCGYLQDIFGKRNISIIGSIFIMVGIIVIATGHRFFVGVVGMSLAGAGAAIGELSALAG
jgi:MFS family permease